MSKALKDEGWWKTIISSVVSYTVQEGENVEDVVNVGWRLGRRRARILARDFHIYEDVPFGLTILCWWPFKPDLAANKRTYLLNNRRRVLNDPKYAAKAGQGPEVYLRDAIPDNVLRLYQHQLIRRMQRDPIEQIINL